MQAVFLRKSTVIVNHEPVQSIDVLVDGRKFSCWENFSGKEAYFLPPYGLVERNPAVCAMIIDGGSLPPYDEWERMKDAIRPLLHQVEALVEDQLIWQNIQTLDPFSRC